MRNTRISILMLFVLATIFAIYEILGAWQLKRTTGLLQIRPSDNNALITVAEIGHQSLNVGSGNVDMRLKPGEYQIIASDNRSQARANVNVVAKNLATVPINLEDTAVQSDLSSKDKSSNLFSQLLPYVGPGSEFKVTYAYQFSPTAAKATIIITAPTQQGEADALAWIRKVGFDPSQLNIQYVNAKP